MRIFQDGKEVILPRFGYYSLGPLYLQVREEEADAYNTFVEAMADAKQEFQKKFGIPWEPSYPLCVSYFISDLHVFASFARKIEEAAEQYVGGEIDIALLQDLPLIRIGDEI